MTNKDVFIGQVCTFWNNRAELGSWAGTRDIILKKLEMQAIGQFVRDGMHILDIGCGNGLTAIHLAKRYNAEVMGIDFAERMIGEAITMASGQSLKGSLRFQTDDVCNLRDQTERFDLVYTERTLINLPDWPTQEQAIRDILRLVVRGGLYVMCEHSQDGLDQINALREKLGLHRITPPWHNRYFRDAQIKQSSFPGVNLEGPIEFSATYYFLSRVVNAWLAAQEGKDPDYEAPINQLALELPSIGVLGQGKIWLWRKVNEAE